MYCDKCGRNIVEDSLFCNYCGEMLKKRERMRCPNCGCTFDADYLYCDRCGTSLVPEASTEVQPQTSPALPQQPKRRKKMSRKDVAVTIIFSLVVFAVAMFLGLWFSGVINW